MEYKITKTEIKDMSEIFKKSEMAFAVSHSNSWPKKLLPMSVQTGVLN